MAKPELSQEKNLKKVRPYPDEIEGENNYQILTSKKASGVMTGSYPMTFIPIVWAHEATT